MAYTKARTLGSSKKKIRPYVDTDGRLKVNLIKDSEVVKEDLAKLVATQFVPNPNNYKNVEFIDGNKMNCASSNLKWVE